MRIGNVSDFLSQHTHCRIGEGKSGADVWSVENGMLLKHARREAAASADVWRSYQKEAQMYRWFRDNNVSLAPEVLYERQSPDEVILLLKRYRMMRHDETGALLPEILRTLAKIHSLPAPDFLERPQPHFTALSQEQISACADGWNSVLAEHGSRFDTADTAFVAEHINALNERFFPKEYVLVHGDFHCDNLLLDEQGGIKVCDWQNGNIGSPAGDIAFFLSRLSADGIRLEEEELIRCYCAAAETFGASTDPGSIRCDMMLSSLNTAFLFWHQYLHDNPPERVGGIFDKMISDARRLLERL